MKLQDAYASEKNEIGSWEKIGYAAPGEKTDASTYNSDNFAYRGGDDLWTASNTSKLNDCAAVSSPTKENANWKITAAMKDVAQNDGVVTYKKEYGPNCEALTPSFGSIGTNPTN